MKKELVIFIAVAFLAIPAAAIAAGGHDALSCTGCHSLHKAKTSSFILAVEPNTKDLNPKTKKPYTGTTAICLGCHQTPEKGGHGMTAINAGTSHPFDISSVNPKVAQVPGQFLVNGRFECTSCHDPHPSNPNRKYLRVDAGGGANMENFCAACHASKSDMKTAAAGTKTQETKQADPGKKKP